MNSKQPISKARQMKIEQMKKIRAAYIHATENGLVKTTHITLPPLSVMIENHVAQLNKIKMDNNQ